MGGHGFCHNVLMCHTAHGRTWVLSQCTDVSHSSWEGMGSLAQCTDVSHSSWEGMGSLSQCTNVSHSSCEGMGSVTMH